jgi:hypothetical protein
VGRLGSPIIPNAVDGQRCGPRLGARSALRCADSAGADTASLSEFYGLSGPGSQQRRVRQVEIFAAC